MNSSKRLTRDGRIKTDPVFIRDGSELVFTVQETPTQLSIMRMKMADGSVERLHPQATTAEYEATFTPDGSRYAFVQSRANLNLRLVIRDTKQNKEATFDPGSGFANLRRPTFAPDGNRVALAIPSGTGQDIIALNAQAQERTTLTSGGLNAGPAYSPDGKHIAFASSREGTFDIHVMKSDGREVRRLTKSPGFNLRPTWSPDGQHLAFTSNRDGSYEIYVMKADGSDVRRVTENAERDDYASWHPDGKRLVIVGERAGKFDLYLLEVRS